MRLQPDNTEFFRKIIVYQVKRPYFVNGIGQLVFKKAMRGKAHRAHAVWNRVVSCHM